MILHLLLAAGAISSPVGVVVHAGGGLAYENPGSTWQLRGGVGVRVWRVRLDALYERSVKVLTNTGTEGCNESGYAQPGCLIAPHLLGARATVYPFTIGIVEPTVAVVAGWASRSIHNQPGTRNDFAVGGAVGAEVDLKSFYLGGWFRGLRYATYSVVCCGNEWSLGAGIEGGLRF